MEKRNLLRRAGIYKKNNSFRKKIVFFEGLDKSGKSTLCRRARFEGGHEVLMFDRGFVGRRTFYEYRKEKEFPIEDWNELESYLVKGKAYAIVYLKCPPKIAFGRALAIEGKSEFNALDLLYQETWIEEDIKKLRKKGIPILTLNTYELSEDECVGKVLDWVRGG